MPPGSIRSVGIQQLEFGGRPASFLDGACGPLSTSGAAFRQVAGAIVGMALSVAAVADPSHLANRCKGAGRGSPMLATCWRIRSRAFSKERQESGAGSAVVLHFIDANQELISPPQTRADQLRREPN